MSTGIFVRGISKPILAEKIKSCNNYIEMSDNNKFLSNKQINESETKQRKIILESKPTMLMGILTRACNLQCIMCPRVKGEPSALSFDTLKIIFGLFPYLERVSWQGGEVFLLDYFKKLFLATSQYPQISQNINTNGLLIDKEWAKILCGSKVVLVYSIDAVTKSTYESIRCNAKFEDLLRSLDIINDANSNNSVNIKLELHAVVMKRNYRELLLFPEFCKKYNFRVLTFDLLWPVVAPEEDIFAKPDKVAMDYLKQAISQVENKCNEEKIYFNCTFKSYLKSSSYNCEDSNKEQEKILNSNEQSSQIKWECSFPWKNIHLEPDGHVYPECKCKRPIGNLVDNSFEEIWNGEIMQLYRRLIRDGEAEKICSEQCKLYIPK